MNRHSHRRSTLVAPGVRVWTARKYTTTSTLIAAGGTASSAGGIRGLLVDPAFEADELDGLAADLGQSGIAVIAGLSTHAHHDHLLWHPDFGAGPRFSSTGTADAVAAHRSELVDVLGPLPAPLLAVFAQLTPIAGTGVGTTTPLPWDGAEAVLVVHDAHAPGHTALWLPDTRVLLAGDMLSDLELPLPDDVGGLEGYDRGLELLRPFVEQATMLVPGHGHPTDRPLDRWAADRRYLDAILAGADPGDPRRGEPGMEQIHRATLAMAAAR